MTTLSTNTFPAGRFDGMRQSWRDATSWMRKEMATVELRLLCIVLLLLALWGAAIAVFGYPALIIVALTLVPVMFTVLLLITVGK